MELYACWMNEPKVAGMTKSLAAYHKVGERIEREGDLDHVSEVGIKPLARSGGSN